MMAKLKSLDHDRPAIVKARNALKKFMVKVLKKWKGPMIKAAVAAFKSDAPWFLGAAPLRKADLEDIITGIMDSLAALDLTLDQDELWKLISDASMNGGAAALAQINVDDPDITNQVNELAVEYAQNRAAEMVGKKLVDGELVDNPDAKWAITESTRDFLQSDITQAMEEGWSTNDLAGKLEDNYAFSEARADMIARTETAKADIQGNLVAYKNSGVVEKLQWLLSSGHPTPDDCDEFEDMVVGIDEGFPDGPPPLHPSCLCSVIPITGKGAEE